MRNLVLRFSADWIEGEGTDIIGPFTFQGQFQGDASVTLVKQYLGRHQVLYQGQYDGEGTIFGQWSIGAFWRGPFVLQREHQTLAAEESLAEVMEAPPGEYELAEVESR
jgi:hypothetical protein